MVHVGLTAVLIHVGLVTVLIYVTLHWVTAVLVHEILVWQRQSHHPNSLCHILLQNHVCHTTTVLSVMPPQYFHTTIVLFLYCRTTTVFSVIPPRYCFCHTPHHCSTVSVIHHTTAVQFLSYTTPPQYCFCHTPQFCIYHQSLILSYHYITAIWFQYCFWLKLPSQYCLCHFVTVLPYHHSTVSDLPSQHCFWSTVSDLPS